MAAGLGRRAEGQEGRTTRGQEDSRARWQVFNAPFALLKNAMIFIAVF